MTWQDAGTHGDDAARESATGGKKGFWWPGWALVAAAVIGVFALASLADDGGDSGSEPTGDKAVVMCEEFVSDRLKSPGSAEFGRASATSAGAGTWRVRGAVDSENGFGAMMRTDYVCVVSADGDTWTLEDLQHRQRS